MSRGAGTGMPKAGKNGKGWNGDREKAAGRKKPGNSRHLVSIMLLNMNGKKLTEECIASIGKNTFYPNYEIVVVDNGSTDGSVPMLRAMQKKGVVKKLILNGKNLGYSAGVNQGFGACNGKYVYHLDNDTLVEKNWLSKAVEAAENAGGKIGAIGSKIVGRKDFGKGLRGKEIVRERLAVCGAAMMYSKEALEKVGLLDAELWSPIYGEEQDWCYRARNAGFKVLETNASRVFHIGGQDTTKSIRAIARYELLETNRIKAMLYNLSIPDLASHVPGLGLIFVDSLKSGMAPNLLKCYWNNLANWQEVLKQRRKRKARLF